LQTTDLAGTGVGAGSGLGGDGAVVCARRQKVLANSEQINNVTTALSTRRIILNFTEIKTGFAQPDVIRHLYVHVPFCPKICPYCTFYKEASDRNQTQAFLDSLLAELDQRPEFDIRCETIFFGGGTPSALTVKQLEFLLAGLRDRLDLSRLREWTLEMNPATVSLEKARMLLNAGVNRISMGVQSFDPAGLVKLGRVHTAEQALRSYWILREAGFANVNLDFIFGIPGQTLASWMATVEKAISLRPNHLSAYCLTYEEDTEFFRRLQAGEFQQNPEQDARFFEATMNLLAAAGYEQYEISNYAQPGYDCLHNLAYWLGSDYLGIGPSAFSTLGNRRWQNVPNTGEYIEKVRAGIEPISFEEALTPDLRRSEAIAFGLRTNRGILEADLQSWETHLKELRLEGYLEGFDRRVRLTPKGRMVADAIGALFV
jgi:oxygen-independent coproporphyrinogen-3 oxidase